MQGARQGWATSPSEGIELTQQLLQPGLCQHHPDTGYQQALRQSYGQGTAGELQGHPGSEMPSRQTSALLITEPARAALAPPALSGGTDGHHMSAP